MRHNQIVRLWQLGLFLVVMLALLVACGAQGSSTDSSTGDSARTSGGAAANGTPPAVYTSPNFDTSYEGALDARSQLVLGTMELEGTAQAVTPEQAAELLPLWQALQGGTVTASAEVNAVLRQIESQMTAEQLASISAMQLTQEDLRVWMEEQGPGRGGAGQAPPGGSGDGQAPPNWSGDGGEMPPEMATRQAQFQNMTDEERQAMRATMEAGGGMPGRQGGEGGQGGPGGRGGFAGFGIPLEPLIALLEARAAEG